MSAPLVPSPLDYIGRRRFAFYPPIRNLESNEWTIGSGTWSEVEVVNSGTGRRMWLPRACIGGVSETNDLVPVVGLVKELEYRAGSLSPRKKGVVEMPLAAHDLFFPVKIRSERPSGPAQVVAIRLDTPTDSSMNKVLATLGVGALVVCLLAALASALARIP
jgi:hypothetical protein